MSDQSDRYMRILNLELDVGITLFTTGTIVSYCAITTYVLSACALSSKLDFPPPRHRRHFVYLPRSDQDQESLRRPNISYGYKVLHRMALIGLGRFLLPRGQAFLTMQNHNLKCTCAKQQHKLQNNDLQGKTTIWNTVEWRASFHPAQTIILKHCFLTYCTE